MGNVEIALPTTLGSESLYYQLGHATIQVVCDQPEYRAEVQSFWQRHFALVKAGAQNAPTVTFRFSELCSVALPLPLESKEVARSPGLQVWRTPCGFYLRCGASVLALDLDQSSALGCLEGTFWLQFEAEQRDFFLLSLLMLLQRHDLYGLHANGVVCDEAGYLLIGNSGSGKTTLALGLMQEGWHYLSDDALVLQRNQDADMVEALALRRGFACTKKTIAGLESLATIEGGARHLADSKRLVEEGALFPRQFRARCVPMALIFPSIAHAPQSRLVAISHTESLLLLAQQSAGIMTHAALARKQLAVLTQLVHQSRGYRLHLGFDLFEEPALVSQMLRDAG